MTLNEFTYSDLINSTDYNNIINYSVHLTQPEDAYSKGCYYKNSHWYKDFYLYVNSQTVVVTCLMKIETDTTLGGYTLSCRSLVCNNDSSDTVQRVARAFSVAIDNQSIEPVVDHFKTYLKNGLSNNDPTAIEVLDNVIDNTTGDKFDKGALIDMPNSLIDFDFQEFITLNNLKNYDSSLINYLYDFFLDEYGDIGNFYKYSKVDRNNGTYILEDTYDTDMSVVLGGTVKDTPSISSDLGLNSDQAYNMIETIYNIDDVDISAIKGSPIQRIGFRIVTTGLTWYVKISGFEILNNQLEVAENGRLLYATVSKIHYATLFINGSTITKQSGGTITKSYTETFKNYFRTETLDAFGGTDSAMAGEIYNDVYENIGFTGKLAEYTLLGNDYPTPNTTPKTKYPSWIPDDDEPVPVSDDPTLNPVPIRVGTPQPYKRVIPTLTQEPDPVPEDEESKVTTYENDPPDNNKALGNIYDLGTDGVKLGELADQLYDPTNVERICQVWKNNPNESIISLHYMYIQPDKQSGAVVKLGNFNTNINADFVTSRYKMFDCGTRAIERKFNNAMDYQTNISLYLPFSGIHQLDVNEVMNSKIHVKGCVDVISGDILYSILVNRKSSSGTYLNDDKCLYTFTGNCKVDIPFSSSSLNSGLASGIGGVLTSIVSKNPIGALTGAVGTAMGGYSNVSHGGSLSGNTGAMGYKYPYLIIEYPKVIDVSMRGKLFGFASNKTVRVSQLSGYAEFEKVHVDTISCTDEDRQEIERILKDGIII